MTARYASATITLGGVTFPIRSVTYSDQPNEPSPAVAVTRGTYAPIPSIHVTCTVPRRRWRRFARPFLFTCRKCAARALGERSPTRAHHHRCPRRGRR